MVISPTHDLLPPCCYFFSFIIAALRKSAVIYLTANPFTQRGEIERILVSIFFINHFNVHLSISRFAYVTRPS